MSFYKSFNKQIFTLNEYSIVPIRLKDRFHILKWRNEQIYHLRQSKQITVDDQNSYFKNVVKKLFDEQQPNQILFSYLKGDKCIGYGGLVHINWLDKHAEISFIIDTSLEKTEFDFHWRIYLSLIEEFAFKELLFHKIFTYAFDIRYHLYPVLESVGFHKEAELKEHCYFQNKYIDVIIHSKLSNVEI